MARKLSRRLRFAVVLGWGTVAVAAPRAIGQSEPPAAAPARTIENPFAAKRPQPAAAPAAPQTSARRPTPYQNPFANKGNSPPIEPSLKPGPISRWQQPIIPHEEPSAIKSAMMLPRPKAKEPGWDQLPPADRLRQKAFMQDGMADDPTFFNNLIRTASTIRFTPEPLSQPGSILGADLAETASESAPANLPELPGAMAIEIPPVTIPLSEPGASSLGRVSGAVDINPVAALEPAQSDDAVSPEFISDIVDTPEEWLRQAQQAASAAQSEDELSTVIELCNRGIQGVPPAKTAASLRKLAAWAHNRRGELLADAQCPEEAIHDFQVAISLDSTCSLAIHNRAVSLAQRNQFAAALRDFNRVIELNPGLAVAYRNRAELHTALGKVEDAVADYTQAMESLPNDASLLCARAHAYQRLGNHQRAAADLSRAIQLAPQNPEAYTQRGNLAAEQGNYEQAQRDFQWAIEIDPNWADAHRSLAWLQATCTDPKIRNADASLAAAERAMELTPADDYLMLDTLAAAYACGGKFDLAVKCQEKAIAAAPRDAGEALEQRLSLYQKSRAFLNRPADASVRTAAHESADPPPPGPRPSPKLGPR